MEFYSQGVGSLAFCVHKGGISAHCDAQLSEIHDTDGSQTLDESSSRTRNGSPQRGRSY